MNAKNKYRKKMFLMTAVMAGALGLWSCGSKEEETPIETENPIHETQNEQSVENTNADLEDSGKENTDAEDTNVTKEPEVTEKPVASEAPAEETVASGDKKSSPYHLEDTVFFGDSRTLGLSDFDVVPEATVIAYRGIAITKVGEKKVIQSGNDKITMIEALKKCKCKRVFVMFGMNELGWPYEDTFKNAYKKLIEQIKEAQPNAKIYVQGIFPMTEGRTDDTYNNDNIKKFNGYIQDVAEEMQVTYVDISPAIVNEQGTLPKEGSEDGIHLNKEYCQKWMAFVSDIVKKEEEKQE